MPSAVKRAQCLPKTLQVHGTQLLSSPILEQVTPHRSTGNVNLCLYSINLISYRALREGVAQIVEEIRGVFEPHGHAHRARFYVCSGQLRCAHSVVRCIDWEHYERFDSS